MRRKQVLIIGIVALVLLTSWVALANGSTSVFQGFERYRVNGTSWEPMVDGNAYFRDAFVGGVTAIIDATDGEQWGGTMTPPNGLPEQWLPVTFYREYEGKSNCFMRPGWNQPVCGSNSIMIRWYAQVQCQPTGLWRFSFTHNGVVFDTPEFTLLPQVPGVPLLKQGGRTTPYDSICKGDLDEFKRRKSVPCGGKYQTPWPISAKGCNLVCAAMVLRYHGVDTGIDDKPVTPENLNTWLIGQRDGFGLEGDLNWDKLTKYSGGAVTYRNPTKATVDSQDALREELCQHGPTVIRVPSPSGQSRGHFVVATGRDYPQEGTWLINDPAGGEATNLAAKYSNRYYYSRRFTGPEFKWQDRLSGMTIKLYSPAELLLTDPQGRRTGRDPIGNVDFEEIPESAYVDDSIVDPETGEPVPPIMAIEVLEPIEGMYRLQVIGTQAGSYSLYIRPLDKTGESPAQIIFGDIPTYVGAVHHYILEYSASPGALLRLSGGFDGHGQRPSDVNKFLSYANPMSARVQLQPGQGTFPLMIFYGATIQPQTFRARLNGMDITAQFHPVPGGTELINLSLVSGSNSLTLSVEGTTASGRVATDTDRLVFLVP